MTTTTTSETSRLLSQQRSCYESATTSEERDLELNNITSRKEVPSQISLQGILLATLVGFTLIGWVFTGAVLGSRWSSSSSSSSMNSADRKGLSTSLDAQQVSSLSMDVSGPSVSRQKLFELWEEWKSALEAEATAVSNGTAEEKENLEKIADNDLDEASQLSQETKEELSKTWKNKTIVSNVSGDENNLILASTRDATSEVAARLWETLHSFESEEAAQSFSEWWEQASADEKDWWNHTFEAFDHFRKGVVHGSENWWNNTEHSVEGAWNNTEHSVEGAWSSTEHSVEGAWNSTEKSVEGAWNSTSHSVEGAWNSTTHWFSDHETSFAEPERPLLYLNSTQAYSWLMTGYGWFDYSSDYYLLESGLDAQINQGYCGVATATGVLNSLRTHVELPVDPMYDPYPYATQTRLMNNSCVNRKAIRYNSTFDGIFHVPGGLNMLQVSKILKCYLPSHWTATVHNVDPAVTTIDEVRTDLMAALKNPKARVIVNFDRAVLGQQGHGHFSSLGSFSSVQDAFLVVDVAKYKYPSVWVPTERLFASLATIDRCSDWDFPQGQDRVTTDFLHARTPEVYLQALEALNCTSSNRGYIIVKPA